MNLYRKLSLTLLCVVIMACSPGQNQTSTETSTSANEVSPNVSTEPSSDCQLTLGFDMWEPYQYVDVDGRNRGLDIEIVESVLTNMGCKTHFVQGVWVNLLEDLKSGQIDILLGASKTPAREAFALFSDAYRTEEFSLYIRKEDDIRGAYNDIDDFINNQSRIGIVGDYYYGPRMAILLEGSATSKLFVPSIMGELNVARLLDMDIDGFVEDSFVGASMLRRKGLGQYIVAHGFSVKTGDIFVMFSQATVSPNRVSGFNSALASFKSSSDFKKIVNKYRQ